MSSYNTPEAMLQVEPCCGKTNPQNDYLFNLIKNRPTSALCHALRIRLNGSSDANQVVARFDSFIADTGLPPNQVVVWHEDLPVSSSDPAAARRCATELSRPLDIRHGALRAVILAFADGVADLVLVASRRFIDSANLRTMAEMLTDTRTLESRAPYIRHFPAADGISDGPFPANSLEWGLGGLPAESGYRTMMGEVWDKTVPPLRLIEAICVVLARFDARNKAEFGLIGAPNAIANGEQPAARLVRVDLEEAKTIVGLAAVVEQCLSFGCKDEVLENSHAVGIIWDSELAAYGNLVEVRSHLTPPFDLTLEPRTEDGHVVGITYSFDRGCFSLETVRMFDLAVANVCAVLDRDQADGLDKPLASIGLLDLKNAEKVAKISTYGRVPTGFKPYRIEQQIASLAASQPNARALTYEDRSLSYRELDEMASRMAGVLQALGVQEGDHVGVCLSRSLELVPVMLAIFKAGTAYVPIDPAYPADRIAYMLDDARPSLVVVAEGGALMVQNIRTINVSKLLELAAAFEGEVKPPLRLATAAAYVIYTSGSSGRPKGVVVPHRNVASLIAATEGDFELSSEDTWTLFHSSAFDFSVWEIWGCLATGGHLIVVPYWVTRSPEEFAQLLVRERVTVLNQTPSAFTQLIASEKHSDEKLALRLVVFGGEPLDARILLRWFDRYPETVCRLVNMFGITETTVHVTAETVTRTHALSNSRAVGHALPGWSVYVMDIYGHMLPPGIPGEIYVGGAGVAGHYLNREDLNAQRFLSDPFFDGRMYRSGDRGRLRADGRLEHLGRLDSQVKIRGFRIELDEIRAVLLECPYVSAAAVLVNRASVNDTASDRLDAYVVLDEGTVGNVRRHAERMLPEHMVPSTVTALEVLPLTANGKLDTAKLPAPKLGSAAKKASRQPVSDNASNHAGDTLLEMLRRIWNDTLDTDVSEDDNFFELGGNSLFAVRIATAMRAQGLPSLPLRELYLRQTLRGVADYLNAISTSDATVGGSL